MKTYLVHVLNVSDNGRYQPEGYAALLNPDYLKSVYQLSDCLSLCSFNQTCSAMSYDGFTSTCQMSAKPTLLNISSLKAKTFLKEEHVSSANVMKCEPLKVQGTLVKHILVFG